jgi:peptide/nickel transport system substrate-binding protein
MDIGIYARPEYYFQYDSADFQQLMVDLNAATDPDARSTILKAAQQMISDDYVNGYLFQLASATVANANIVGLWHNAPTQATDLTAVYWND